MYSIHPVVLIIVDFFSYASHLILYALLLPTNSIQKPVSYVSGWLSSLSWLGGVASGMFLSSQLIPALVALHRPEYQLQPWHSYLIMLAILSVVFTFDAYLTRYLPLLEVFVISLTAASFVAVLVALLVLSPKLSSTEVFQTFTPTTSTNLLQIMGSQALILYSFSHFQPGSQEWIEGLWSPRTPSSQYQCFLSLCVSSD